MANWDIKKNGALVRRVRDGEGFEIEGIRIQPRDFSQGLQCHRLEEMGYTVDQGQPDPPPPPPTHEQVVRADAHTVQYAHISDAQVSLIHTRVLKMLGTTQVTGVALTQPQKDIASAALAAAEWAANVQRERDRAIAAGDAPAWPAWNDGWNVIFDHI